MAQHSAELRAPLCSHSEHIVAEAVDAFAGEYAVTLGDVLLRRVPVALGGCWSPACSREAAARIGAVMGWNETQSAAELEAFEASARLFCASRRAWVRCWKPPPTSRQSDGGRASRPSGLRADGAGRPSSIQPYKALSGDAVRPRRRCSLQRAHQEFGVIGDDSIHSPVSQATHAFLVIYGPHKNSAAALPECPAPATGSQETDEESRSQPGDHANGRVGRRSHR